MENNQNNREIKKNQRVRKEDLTKLLNCKSEQRETVEKNAIEQITFGWQNAIEVAADVWKDGNYKLLAGDLVFAYKNTGDVGSKLHQVVVVKYFNNDIHGNKIYSGKYGVSVVTAGYSYLIPETCVDYLEEVYSELIENKINKDIQKVFRNIIDELR